MGMPIVRVSVAKGEAEVERAASDAGWRAVGPSEEMNLDKGKFRGYSKNPLEGRAERQGKRRAWGQSRKNQSKRTRAQYQRSKVRGSGSGARPKMRRQLGAGGSRPSRDR